MIRRRCMHRPLEKVSDGPNRFFWSRRRRCPEHQRSRRPCMHVAACKEARVSRVGMVRPLHVSEEERACRRVRSTGKEMEKLKSSSSFSPWALTAVRSGETHTPLRQQISPATAAALPARKGRERRLAHRRTCSCRQARSPESGSATDNAGGGGEREGNGKWAGQCSAVLSEPTRQASSVLG